MAVAGDVMVNTLKVIRNGLERFFSLTLACAVFCSFPALAATLNFNNNNGNSNNAVLTALNSSNSCKSGNWSFSGSTFTCSGNIEFSNGDDIRTDLGAITIRAEAGIRVRNNSVGTSGNRINLQTTYGLLRIEDESVVYGNLSSGSGGINISGDDDDERAIVFGSVTSDAAINVTEADITGSLQSSYGNINFDDVNLTGNVTSSSGVIDLDVANISGTVTTNADVVLTDSTVGGKVTSSSNDVIATDTTFGNGISAHSGIQMTGGSVAGDLRSGCNNIILNSITMTSGTIQTTPNLGGGCAADRIQFTNSTINANIIGGANNVYLNDTAFTGNIQARFDVELDNSSVIGNISGEQGYALHDVVMTDSEVYGDVTVNTSFGEITGNWPSSAIYGDCEYDSVTPSLCNDGPAPSPTPYWKFDEALWNGSANEVLDSSSKQRHGRARNAAVTATTNPSPASCTYGDFQRGSSSSNNPYVDIGRNSYFHDADNFSFSLWLKMNAADQPGSRQVILAYGADNGVDNADDGRFELLRTSGGALRFAVRMENEALRYVEATGNVFNGQWHHVAVSYSKANQRMRLYVDNVLVANTPNSPIGNGNSAKTPNDGDKGLSIGALPNGSHGIKGQIDEVRFLASELTSTDVETFYEQEASCSTGGLVLGWDLNQGLWSGAANEVIDFSGNNLHGRTYNSVQSLFDNTALSGDPGTCSFSQFNGTNQYIETADNNLLDISSALTLSVWVKPSSRPASGLMTIVSKDNNYEVHQQTDGRVQWWWNDTTPTARQLVSTTALTLNQWNHVAIVYSSGAQKIFINGVQDATSSFTGALTTNNSPLQLGQDQGVAGRYFNGFLDELRIYNSALATSAVQALQTERRSCSQCFTENFYTTENWYASAYGGSELPSTQISPQRLRLTRNITEQSTSMTIRKKFPGIGNKVSVEFNYYAWKPASGGGADGIAVTLSDANYIPAPGSFGGSLGYAQRTSPNDPGFNGGWIGIGLDEFGNFSNPTEGRQGGVGSRPQAVALRGSLPNYNYLTGATVAPNIDVVGTGTPGPGHRYRITVDATTTTPTQTALVKVERDTTGTGNSYSTIINNYNAAAAAGQQAVPEDFFLSFTGATGASVNNHEIATIQVCTVQPAPDVVIVPPSTVHHYELNYVSNGVTCEAEQIEVKACANASCSTLATAAVSTTISANNGGSFVGGTTLNFTGSTVVTLQQTNAGETTLAVAGGANPNVCSTTGCKINFATAGFKFYNATSGTDGLQNQVAGVQGSGYLRAVQTNTNTMACEARVVGTRNVSMSYNCVNPGSCITGQTLQLGAVNFNGSEEGANKNVSLTFNAQGYAPLSINYSDVGQLTLSASLALAASGNNPAVTLVGQSDPFVVRPHRINVTTALSSAPANAANPQTQGTGAGFVAAGENFQLYVSPVNAQGNLTPNYGNETTPENVAVQFGQLLYPAAGVAGILTSAAAFEKVSGGPYANRFHSDEVSWNEVGTIALTASVADGNYMGTGLGAASASTAYAVGRFYPAHFSLDSSSLSQGCNGFSYMGKAGISLNYQLSARNVAEQVTANYSTNFAPKATAAVVLENADDGVDLSARMSSAAGTWQAGLMTVTQNNLTFNRAPAVGVVDGPFESLTAGIRLTDTFDGRDFATGLKNMQSDTAGSCGVNCNSVALSNTLNLRYGRLKVIGGTVADAPSAGSVELPVTLQAEYWNGSNFVLNVADSFVAPATPGCTQVNYDQVVVTSGSNSPAVGGLMNQSLIQGVSASSPAAVYFNITPGTPVSVWPIKYENTPLWLQYNWSQEAGAVTLEDPFSEISVGRYRGNKRQIFWQEKLN